MKVKQGENFRKKGTASHMKCHRWSSKMREWCVLNAAIWWSMITSVKGSGVGGWITKLDYSGVKREREGGGRIRWFSVLLEKACVTLKGRK